MGVQDAFILSTIFLSLYVGFCLWLLAARKESVGCGPKNSPGLLDHSSMDYMDFSTLPLGSLFATAEPADEAAKLSSAGPSCDEDTTFFIEGSNPLIERLHHAGIQSQLGQS